MPPGSPEYSMVRNYCEWMSELPWSRATALPIDLQRAKQILDDDHFDLDKVW